ncbi:MAG: fibronectin type III domain-containing protein [Candidatus Thermoplasmatota archaeon]|nr:fibronectin type III domain-containing protein [Candidatus Thermoplasmatota archaeon]
MSAVAMRLFLAGLMLSMAMNALIPSSGSSASEPDIPSTLSQDEETGLFFMENLGQLEREDIDLYVPGETTIGIGAGIIQFTYHEDNNYLSTLRIELLGALDSEPMLIDPSPTLYNFFLGSDPDEWVTGARAYSTVLYPEIYPFIDMRIYSRESSLKYDLIVRPGGDPSNILIAYRGADSVLMIDRSHLRILCGGLFVEEGPLYSYQEHTVDSSYIVEGDLVRVEVDDFDRNKDLVIDPLLLASTYVGGNNWDRYPKVEMDHLDRPVIAMSTDSTNMPTSAGSYSTLNRGETDIYIARMSKDLSNLISSTYFGGSDYETLGGLVIGKDGKVYIDGATNSTNLPTTSSAFQVNARNGKDAFIACFNPDLASLHYSTFLGGDDSDVVTDIDVDSSGSAYVTGVTYSTDFPLSSNAFQKTRKGFFDTFVTKMTPDGTDIQYSTLIGGGGVLWGERAETIKVDSSGRAIIAGMSVAEDYPVTDGSYNTEFGFYMGFVTRFSQDGSSLDFSTFFSNGTFINAIDLGPDENIFMTGRTVSVAGHFDVTPDAYDRDLSGNEDAFFSVLGHDGTSLLYSTFLGANEKYMDQDEFEELERAWDIRADESGRAYIVGETDSILFPITMGAYDNNLNDREGFITIFSPNWSRIEYSSFIGGRDQDTTSGISLNRSNGMYICGDTYSDYPNHDFPVTSKAYDQSFSSAYDGYLVHFKLDSYPPGPPRDISYMSEDSFINLSWRTPLSDGGEEIISYRIYRGLTSNNLIYMDRVDPDVLFYNDTSVTNGRPYYYGIRAENIVSRGEWGYITAVATTRPGPPIIYKTVISDRSLNVSWFRPSNDGGINELSYTLYFGDPSSLEVLCSGIKTEWYNISGLVNGRSYNVAISASNWRGEGPLSEVLEVVPMATPSKPRDLTGYVSPFRVYLTWLAPIEKGGSDNITYDVYMGQNLSSMESAASMLNVTDVDIPVSVIGVRMTIYVKARNELGLGQRSDLLNITTLGDLSRPMNLTAVEGGDHVNLSWKPPTYNGGAANITYFIHSGWDPFNLSIMHAGVHGMEMTITPVIPGKRYYFAVSAYNGHWEGPLSEVVDITPFQVPGVPLNLKGTIGNRLVNLSWEVPSFYGGFGNISYDLFMAVGNGTFGYVRWLNGNQTIVRGLENGIDHTFYVKAYNLKGRSLGSNLITLRPMTIPSKPRNPFYLDGDEILNISWDPPMDNGGSVHITYTLYFGDSEDDLEPLIEGISETFYMMTGLKNGERYYTRITAVNVIGSSEPSDLLIGIPMKLPTAPTNLNISWQEGGVLVKWDPPEDSGGGEIWIFRIYRGLDPGNMTELVGVSASFREYLDVNAVEGTKYYYSISCETAKGRGPMSEIYELKPPTKEEGGMDLGIPIFIVAASLVLLLFILVLYLFKRNKRRDWGAIEE